MKKTNYTQIKLNKGEIALYNFANIKLHAYKTNDPIDDEVFIIEKKWESCSYRKSMFL